MSCANSTKYDRLLFAAWPLSLLFFAREEGRQRPRAEHDNETISVALISPAYWGNQFELRDAAGGGTPIFDAKAWDRSASYRWDEWPSSVLRSSSGRVRTRVLPLLPSAANVVAGALLLAEARETK